jgi:hypothetical protein
LIFEIYIKIKQNIVKKKIKYLILGRIQLLLLICLTGGALSFIKLIMLYKLIKLIRDNLVYWTEDETQLICRKTVPYYCLNKLLFPTSYILKHLNFNNYYLGYKKLLHTKDSYLDDDPLYAFDANLHFFNISKSYFSKRGDDFELLQYLDLKGGIYMNEISELNFLIQQLYTHRIDVEYNLEYAIKDEKVLSSIKDIKTLEKDIKELELILKDTFNILRVILKKLQDNNVKFSLFIKFDTYNCNPELIIKFTNEYLKNFKLIKKELTIHKELKQLMDLNELYLKKIVRDSSKDLRLVNLKYMYYYSNIAREDEDQCRKEIKEKYLDKFIKELID